MAGPAAEPQLDPLLPLQSWGLRGCSCGKNSLVNNRVQTGNGTSSKGDSDEDQGYSGNGLGCPSSLDLEGGVSRASTDPWSPIAAVEGGP